MNIRCDIRLILILVFAILVFHTAFSQRTEEKKGKPDLPGTFLLELGFSVPQNTADKFETGLLGSRTLNVYYQHDIVIPAFKNKLSFSPGVGFGLDRFRFSNNYTLDYQSGNLTMSRMNLDISKSQLITNYLDVPVELKFTNNPGNPSKSFKLALGFRGGVLLNAHTKLKYDDDGETIKTKTRRDWELNPYRYGIYSKIGVGNIYFMGYYNLSTLFKNEQGPDKSSVNNLTFGISWAGF